MSFRIGQKVVCIIPDNGWVSSPRCMVLPHFNQVYTVRGLKDDLRGQPYVWLYEILNPICSCADANDESAYVAGAFRPVIEEGTKSKQATRLIDRLSTRRLTSAAKNERAEAYFKMKAALRRQP